MTNSTNADALLSLGLDWIEKKRSRGFTDAIRKKLDEILLKTENPQSTDYRLELDVSSPPRRH